jgi:hypothetical protein
MVRKLKTYITNLGFFELALAAPSMKAALEAWGMGHNVFHQGFARETHDAKIVAAAMAKPGVVLRRPVGTKGAFTENAALPKQLWTATKAGPAKPKMKAKSKKAESKKLKPRNAKDEKADRAVILSFEKAKARRDREREQQETREEAKQAKDRAQRQRDTEKIEAALARAQDRHDQAMAVLEKERGKLDRRAEIENDRWEAERDDLKAALRRPRD